MSKFEIATQALKELRLIEVGTSDPKVSIQKLKDILVDYFESVRGREIRKQRDGE